MSRTVATWKNEGRVGEAIVVPVPCYKANPQGDLVPYDITGLLWKLSRL